MARSAGVAGRPALLVGLVLATFCVDQGTKYAAVSGLTSRFYGLEASARLEALYGPPPEPGRWGLRFQPVRAVTVAERFFRIRYAEHPGALWGRFDALPGHLRAALLALLPLTSLWAMGRLLFGLRAEAVAEARAGRSRGPSKGCVTRGVRSGALVGLALVFAGAAGNLVDRLSRGFVIGFLELHWGDVAAWAPINVADVAVAGGAALLIGHALSQAAVTDPGRRSRA